MTHVLHRRLRVFVFIAITNRAGTHRPRGVRAARAVVLWARPHASTLRKDVLDAERLLAS